METRETFLKGEIQKIKKILDVSYLYLPYSSSIDDEERLMKIIELLFEINEKTLTLKSLIKGSY